MKDTKHMVNDVWLWYQTIFRGWIQAKIWTDTIYLLTIVNPRGKSALENRQMRLRVCGTSSGGFAIGCPTQGDCDPKHMKDFGQAPELPYSRETGTTSCFGLAVYFHEDDWLLFTKFD